jgi:hypothetical protein
MGRSFTLCCTLLCAAAAQGRAETSNMSCVERLHLPMYPRLADAARISATVTTKIRVGSAGTIQGVASEVRGGVGETFRKSFLATVEEAVRDSAFAAACAGRTITVEFQFSLGEQAGTERVSFAYPNRFTVFAAAKVIQGSGQSLRDFLHSLDEGLKDRFVAALADLNSDGTPEAIVHLTSSDWCGSGGCTTLVLARDSDSWKLLTKITITRPPIRMLTTKSNGWHSIGVWVQGGGVQPGYEAELRFDGKTYPTNPSNPPAKPSVGNADGEAVIPAGR